MKPRSQANGQMFQSQRTDDGPVLSTYFFPRDNGRYWERGRVANAYLSTCLISTEKGRVFDGLYITLSHMMI